MYRYAGCAPQAWPKPKKHWLMPCGAGLASLGDVAFINWPFRAATERVVIMIHSSFQCFHCIRVLIVKNSCTILKTQTEASQVVQEASSL